MKLCTGDIDPDGSLAIQQALVLADTAANAQLAIHRRKLQGDGITCPIYPLAFLQQHRLFRQRAVLATYHICQVS